MLIPQRYADVVLDHAKCVDVRLGWTGSLAIPEDTCLFNFAMKIQTGNSRKAMGKLLMFLFANKLKLVSNSYFFMSPKVSKYKSIVILQWCHHCLFRKQKVITLSCP